MGFFQVKVLFQKVSETDFLELRSVIPLQKIDILEKQTWMTEAVEAIQYLIGKFTLTIYKDQPEKTCSAERRVITVCA